MLLLWQEAVVSLDVRALISALEEGGNFARPTTRILVLKFVALMWICSFNIKMSFTFKCCKYAV